MSSDDHPSYMSGLCFFRVDLLGLKVSSIYSVFDMGFVISGLLSVGPSMSFVAGPAGPWSTFISSGSSGMLKCTVFSSVSFLCVCGNDSSSICSVSSLMVLSSYDL